MGFWRKASLCSTFPSFYGVVLFMARGGNERLARRVRQTQWPSALAGGDKWGAAAFRHTLRPQLSTCLGLQSKETPVQWRWDGFSLQQGHSNPLGTLESQHSPLVPAPGKLGVLSQDLSDGVSRAQIHPCCDSSWHTAGVFLLSPAPMIPVTAAPTS